MAILNQTTKVASEQTIAEIFALLASHGAVSVTQRNRDCAVATISFVLNIRDVNVSFRLPVNEAGVESYLVEETLAKVPLIRRQAALFSSERRAAIKAQARRTAWRIQKDWITAQLALVASRQAEMDEVFLPYAVDDNGQTLYESFLAKNRLQLAGGTVPNG